MTDNPPIRIYLNQIKNSVILKITTWYYLELLTAEMIKLLGSTKNKISKYENGENVSHLEVSEVVLVYCNIKKFKSLVYICS